MSIKTDTGVPARLQPSPNHNARQGEVRLLVLHYTGMRTAEEAVRRLCDPSAEVSAHYLVDEDGGILQLVPESRRAWHAGKAYWKGERDINSRSIGIELVNPGHEHGYRRFADAQIEAVIALSRDICGRHEIAPADVLAHSDVAPDRKQDPGELFPWDRLAAAGIGLHVHPEPVSGGRFFQEGDGGQPVEALQSMLALYGFEMPISGIFDTRTRLAVAAFQRHHRQARVDGIADMSTITTLHRLLQQVPRLA